MTLQLHWSWRRFVIGYANAVIHLGPLAICIMPKPNPRNAIMERKWP